VQLLKHISLAPKLQVKLIADPLQRSMNITLLKQLIQWLCKLWPKYLKVHDPMVPYYSVEKLWNYKDTGHVITCMHKLTIGAKDTIAQN